MTKSGRGVGLTVRVFVIVEMQPAFEYTLSVIESVPCALNV
jgi:hypothetical protein